MTRGRALRLWCEPGSKARDFTGVLQWLWGESGGANEVRVGIGTAGEASELQRLVSEGRIQGAVVLCAPSAGEGGDGGRPLRGTAKFENGHLRGGFWEPRPETAGRTLPALTSGLGTHAFVGQGLLWVGAPADGDWGSLRVVWVLSVIRSFLEGSLGLSVRALPPIGCLRLDDMPGTAEFQLHGKAKSDRKQARFARRLAGAAARSGSVLNIASACRALADGDASRRVPLEQVWPRAVEELRAGVAAGAMEPVCHGYLGLVPEALDRGEVDYHEFGTLSRAEARDLLARIVAWQRQHLGETSTFVAVDWTYSDGALAAAEDVGLAAWLPPAPAPPLRGHRMRESLHGPLDGVSGVDLRPLAWLADCGLPPTVTLHGRSFDNRRAAFRIPRDSVPLVRAYLRRDIFRLLGLGGVEWVGASRMRAALEEHALQS